MTRSPVGMQRRVNSCARWGDLRAVMQHLSGSSDARFGKTGFSMRSPLVFKQYSRANRRLEAVLVEETTP